MMVSKSWVHLAIRIYPGWKWNSMFLTRLFSGLWTGLRRLFDKPCYRGIVPQCGEASSCEVNVADGNSVVGASILFAAGTAALFA